MQDTELMNGYTLTQKEHTRLKGRLTRALKAGDPDKIIKEAAYAKVIFERNGYPDDWSRWQRAADDAEYQKQRGRPRWI